MKKKVLTVIMEDDSANVTALVHQNEWRPFAKRTVRIKLTPEQQKQIEPRRTSGHTDKGSCETIFDCWLEDAEDDEDA